MDKQKNDILAGKARLDRLISQNPDIITNLNHWYRVEVTYTSNFIEGNTLTRQETALVIDKNLTVEGRSITEHLEAVNHAKAWDYIQNLKHSWDFTKISERQILDIHAQILQNIDNTNAGKYRTVPVRIAGSTVIMPNPVKVPDLMEEFIKWLQNSTDDVIDTAIMAHYKLVSIHPFTDGNGRVARLILNLILMSADFPPLIIPAENRRAYLISLETAQLTGNLSDYQRFMYANIRSSLDQFIQIALPGQSQKLLLIGELAGKSGETIPTIRYWTKQGLLKVKQTAPNGYQYYDSSQIQVVSAIRHLKSQKRLTLVEIKKFLPT